MSEDNYLKTKRESARYLAISQGTLERLMRAGLPYVRIGGSVRFKPADLADFVEQRRIQRSGDAA